jgi:hypothetical protein
LGGTLTSPVRRGVVRFGPTTRSYAGPHRGTPALRPRIPSPAPTVPRSPSPRHRSSARHVPVAGRGRPAVCDRALAPAAAAHFHILAAREMLTLLSTRWSRAARGRCEGGS